MTGRLPTVPSNDPTRFCRLCFAQARIHWVIRTNGTAVDQPFVNTIGECLGVWLSLSEDFPCAVCRQCTERLEQIMKMRELARMCDVALKQKRREDPSSLVLFYDYPEDRVWMNGATKPGFYQDDSDFENEPILPEVVLDEFNEELQKFPRKTRMTQAEKESALKGYFEMYAAWKESTADVKEDDEETVVAPEALAEEHGGVSKKDESYSVRYREQPTKACTDPTSATWCPICQLDFLTVKRFSTHVYEKHNSKGKTCQECGQTFASSMGMKQHMIRHKNSLLLTCNKCGLQFVNESELEGHRTTDGCRQTADQVYGKCQYCDRTFSRQGRYIFHLKRLHPDKPLPKRLVPQQKSGRIDVRRKSAPPARTSPLVAKKAEPTKPQPYFNDWRYRTSTGKSGRTTIEKGRFLVTLERLSAEQIELHQQLEPPPRMRTSVGFHFVCIMCHGEFRDLDNFNDHLDECCLSNGIQPGSNPPPPPPYVMCECDKCAIIYKQVDQFVEHLQEHDRPYEVKPHDCVQCLRRGSKSRRRSRALSRYVE